MSTVTLSRVIFFGIIFEYKCSSFRITPKRYICTSWMFLCVFRVIRKLEGDNTLCNGTVVKDGNIGFVKQVFIYLFILNIVINILFVLFFRLFYKLTLFLSFFPSLFLSFFLISDQPWVSTVRRLPCSRCPCWWPTPPSIRYPGTVRASEERQTMVLRQHLQDCIETVHPAVVSTCLHQERRFGEAGPTGVLYDV